MYFKLDRSPVFTLILPSSVETYRNREAKLAEWERFMAPSPLAGEGWGEGVNEEKSKSTKPSWTNNYWFANATTLRANDFNLSAGRYRPMSAAQVAHRNPRDLLDELVALETEIVAEVEALRVALAERAG